MPDNLNITATRHEEILSRRRRRLVAWLFGFIGLTLGAWAFAVAEYDPGRLLSEVGSPASVIFLTQSALSIVLGVFSALAYGAFENRTYKATVTRLFNAGPPDLVDEAITLLDDRKGTLVFDYEVEYHLSAADVKGLLILKVKFSYKKLLRDRDLFFRVMRLRSEEEQRRFEASQSSVDALYAKSELFFLVPEYELREKFGDDPVEKAYAFEYIKIGGSKISPEAIPTDPGTLHTRVPDTYDLTQPISIEYCFRYGVPEADLVFCVAEFPTKGAEIRFMRDGPIRASTGVFAFELMSATRGNATVAEDTPGTHSVVHSGWVLPKSGAVFQWYPVEQGAS